MGRSEAARSCYPWEADVVCTSPLFYARFASRLLSDLCIRSKKVFSHEHVLYPPNVLPLHLPSMYHKINQRAMPKEQIEGGVHPMCEFCRECFFSDDELYQHMRQNHEECFVCKRNEIQHQ